jgi:hypothetical protein
MHTNKLWWNGNRWSFRNQEVVFNKWLKMGMAKGNEKKAKMMVPMR